ncbi:hypothetical protein [Paenibacillus naphthalenovorans]|uniref:RNA polymerase n=1 Tax=Paenibacillus naphthalenovorans TaxID=162209 RepID=A0A0U2VNF3_9BACL|nr:hypothetical protein [Paenibacillus naphthalenovorans]ALS22262.1 hypothetical protein IJ22_18880 [Paenibacillus naphthalenovorans]
MDNQNIYQENGYTNRREYLESLAEDYGVSLETVLAIADMYGESEDFDGLLSALEDAQDMEL